MKSFSFDVIHGQRHKVLLFTLFVLLALTASSQSAGPYELTWSTIDGGGGRSSSGPYVLMGTIGQPDAAYTQGGRYELLGGFWPGGPLCFVDFKHFARFAEHWLQEDCSKLNNWCYGADLYKDGNNIVNRLDLKVFVEQWLCYCPAGWPLK